MFTGFSILFDGINHPTAGVPSYGNQAFSCLRGVAEFYGLSSMLMLDSFSQPKFMGFMIFTFHHTSSSFYLISLRGLPPTKSSRKAPTDEAMLQGTVNPLAFMALIPVLWCRLDGWHQDHGKIKIRTDVEDIWTCVEYIYIGYIYIYIYISLYYHYTIIMIMNVFFFFVVGNSIIIMVSTIWYGAWPRAGTLGGHWQPCGIVLWSQMFIPIIWSWYLEFCRPSRYFGRSIHIICIYIV